MKRKRGEKVAPFGRGEKVANDDDIPGKEERNG